jgi:hypothetical protein
MVGIGWQAWENKGVLRLTQTVNPRNRLSARKQTTRKHFLFCTQRWVTLLQIPLRGGLSDSKTERGAAWGTA